MICVGFLRIGDAQSGGGNFRAGDGVALMHNLM
jgi:hypothetical protein